MLSRASSTATAAVLLLSAATVLAQEQLFTPTDSKFLEQSSTSSSMQLYPVYGQQMQNESEPMVKDVQLKCQYMAGLNFYDLQPLGIAKNYYYVPAMNGQNRSVYISFCQDLPESLWCEQDPQPTMAVLIDETEEGVKKCVRLSGESPTKNAAFNVSDPDNNDGLTIEYNGGDQGYNLVVDIECDKDTDFLFLNSDYTNNEQLLISFKTKVGCKYDQLSQIWNFFTNNKWAMFAFFVIAGGMLCFAGRAMLKPTLFLTGILIASFLIIYIFYTTFLRTSTEEWIGWAVLGGAVVAGLILGYVFQKFAKVGVFCLAAWGGFSLGLILYNAVIYKMDNNSQTFFWITTIGCAIVLGVLTLVIFDHILIQSTAIIGSFMFCYGIGLVAGHYPNPFTLVEMIKNGQMDSIDPLYYAYMGGNLVLYIIGCVVQYRHKKKNPEYNPEERFSFKRRGRGGRKGGR